MLILDLDFKDCFFFWFYIVVFFKKGDFLGNKVFFGFLIVFKSLGGEISGNCLKSLGEGVVFKEEIVLFIF